MRKVLVPVDNSEGAQRALAFAIGLTKDRAGAEVHVVHAHEMPVAYGEIAVYTELHKVEEQLRRHSEAILAPAVEKAKAAGVAVRSEILVGDVAQSIVEYADRNGCDGIVMGTRGMGAIGNLLMGSVATKVIHLTGLPVTLIK